MGIGPQGFSRIDVTAAPYYWDPTGATAVPADRMAAAVADANQMLLPANGLSPGRYYFDSQMLVNRPIEIVGPSLAAGALVTSMSSIEAANGVTPIKIAYGGVHVMGVAIKHRDYAGNLPAIGHIFPQWRPGTAVPLNKIVVPSFSPSGPGQGNVHWGWALKCTTAGTPGGTTAADEPSWSGLIANPKSGAAPGTIADGSVVWTPVVVHGIEVESYCEVYANWIIGFPSNLINMHCSQGYVPSVNANRSFVDFCCLEGAGGAAFFRYGSDVGAGAASRLDMRGNRGGGVNDPGSSNFEYSDCHAAVNELPDYLFENAEGKNNYAEGGYGGALIRANGAWYGGIGPGFHGSLSFTGIPTGGAAAPSYWQPDTAYAENAVTKPPAGARSPQNIDATGYFYKTKYARPDTTVTAKTFTTPGGSATITSASHGYSARDIVRLTNSGGGLPAGLSAGVDYYIKSPTATTYEVSLSSGGVSIVPTTPGTGTHSSTRTTYRPGDGTSTTSVTYTGSNSGGDLLLTTGAAHGLTVGKKIVVTNTGGTFPSSLAANITYWVVSVPLTTTFKVSLTSGGTAVTWSSNGTGTNKFALQPIWLTGIYTHGPGLGASHDGYGNIDDGTAIWECYQLSEVSTGQIDLAASGFDRKFNNRTTGELFRAGGSAANEVMAWGRTSLNWAFKVVAGTEQTRILKDGSTSKIAGILGDGTAGTTDGRFHFPAGALFGGAALYVNVKFADAKPADSSEPYPTLVFHADAVAGEAIGWKNKADGTWVTMPNYT
jgi:hypothetical protein